MIERWALFFEHLGGRSQDLLLFKLVGLSMMEV
jgi:hypothetical protein